MIRPLEFCQSDAHIQTSIDTIDFRLLELLALREKYTAKATHLQELTANDSPYKSANTLINERMQWAQSLGFSTEIAEDIFAHILNNLTDDELHLDHAFKKNIGNR